MNRSTIHPGAWQADTVDDPSSWYFALPERCLSAFDRTIQELRKAPRPVLELRLGDTPCADCVDELRPALHDLEEGRGFVVIRGLPDARYTADELQALYWLAGQMLGRPTVQNVQGTLLYDVRDLGQDVCYGARFSVTNADLSFHTDNSFGDEVIDYVGLLCLQTAKSGGVNHLISGYALHERIEREDARILDLLHKPFHVDRRGGVRPGEGPTVPYPVFQGVGHDLVCRYLRYWIEAGHESAGVPLTPAQRAALDALDRLAGDPALRVEFTLRPGDMFFINNRWILHSRTAFEDHPEPERRRHYVRLWLQKRGEK